MRHMLKYAQLISSGKQEGTVVMKTNDKIEIEKGNFKERKTTLWISQLI